MGSVIAIRTFYRLTVLARLQQVVAYVGAYANCDHPFEIPLKLERWPVAAPHARSRIELLPSVT